MKPPSSAIEFADPMGVCRAMPCTPAAPDVSAAARFQAAMGTDPAAARDFPAQAPTFPQPARVEEGAVPQGASCGLESSAAPGEPVAQATSQGAPHDAGRPPELPTTEDSPSGNVATPQQEERLLQADTILSPTDRVKLLARRRGLGLEPLAAVHAHERLAHQRGAPELPATPGLAPVQASGFPGAGETAPVADARAGVNSHEVIVQREELRVEASQEAAAAGLAAVLQQIAHDNTPESLPLEVLKAV